MNEKEFPLYVMSETEVNTVYIFRENGQEIKIPLNDYRPHSDTRLFEDERKHLIEKFINHE